MKARADELEYSAQHILETTSAKVEDILSVLNQAIEESKNVDQIKSLTSDIFRDLFNNYADCAECFS